MNNDVEIVEQELMNLEQEIRHLVEILNSDSASLSDKVTSIERLRSVPEELNKYNLRIRSLFSRSGENNLENEEDYEDDLRNEHIERLGGKISELRSMLRNGNDLGNIMDYSANRIVSEYLIKLEKTERYAKRMLSSLVYDFTYIRDINEEVSNLVAEYDGLREQVKEIITLIKGYSLNIYTITEKELEERITNLRISIREIKRQQVRQYNDMITVVNNRIMALRNRMGELPEEIVVQINSLPLSLELCNIEINSYNQGNYLEKINYNELVRFLNLTSEIERSIGRVALDEGDEVTFYETLKAELDNLSVKMDDVESKLASHSAIAIEELKDLINQITEFEPKLVAEHLSVDELNDLKEKYENIKERFENIKRGMGISEPELVYDNYLQQVNELEDKLGHIDTTLIEPALEDKEISEEVLDTLNGDLESINHDLDNLETLIKSSYEIKTLTDEQYNNLTRKINEIREKITQSQEKVSTFSVLRKDGFLKSLDGTIEGLESAITDLEDMVNVADEPISKENRKIIEGIQEEISKEISRIEDELEHHKEEDKDKYESQVARLNECRDRLDKIDKAYRKKCPLRVRAVRSAKNFYKKHKKAVLIVGGLAALSIVLSPVIVPAIMEGNLLIMNRSPLLRPFYKGMNNFLGKSIGASIVKTEVGSLVWQLANGTILSPIITKYALLKGLAISVSGSTILSAPLIAGVVMAIKNLNKKLEKKNKKGKKGSLPEETVPEEVVMDDGESFGPLEDTDEVEEKGGRSR